MIINGFGGHLSTQSMGSGDVLSSGNFVATYSATGKSIDGTSYWYPTTNATSTTGVPNLPLYDYFSRYNSLYFTLNLNRSIFPTLSCSIQCKSSTNKEYLMAIRMDLKTNGLYEVVPNGDSSTVLGNQSRNYWMNNSANKYTQSSSTFTYIDVAGTFNKYYPEGSLYASRRDIGAACWAIKLGATSSAYDGSPLMTIYRSDDSGSAGTDMKSSYVSNNTSLFSFVYPYPYVTAKTSIYNDEYAGGYSTGNSSSYWGKIQSFTFTCPLTYSVVGYY